MQVLKAVRQPTGLLWQVLNKPSHFVSRHLIMLFLVIIGSSTLLYSDLTTPTWYGLPGMRAVRKTTAINGASRWQNDRQVTAPAFDFSPLDTWAIPVSPLFARYYTSHSGGKSLGVPVTTAFPTAQGWIQFFDWGALLLPTVQQKHTYDLEVSQPENSLVALMDPSVSDPSTGIFRLPLLQALLTVGSQAPLGGDGSRLTYVDLRQATNPDRMLSTTAAGRIAAHSSAGSQEIFIKGGTRAGKDVGHLISQPFWSYINRSDISPDGWKTDFGAPLTEALSFTITRQGRVHRMLVQAFWRDGLVLDQSTLDVSGQPHIQRLDTAVAYLRTLGPPAVAMNAQQTIWAQAETPLLNAPGTDQTVGHVGQYFPLTLLGDTTWNSGLLWYHVRWAVPKRTESGWVSAAAITFTSPDRVASWASFDVLSPPLAAYLASMSSNVAVAVYDVTRQHYYTYNANAQFLTASSIKVPILLTFLDTIERQGREPNAREMALLKTMIENSNNDSAGILYHGEVGGAAGVTHFLQRIGINGLDPDPVDFGWSLITPLAMVDLLTDLYEGSILTAPDRKLALYLMEHIEFDQQVGVGDTAPAGATVAMKDGWVPGPDNLWSMNSSGILTLGQETYIIAVYTKEQSSLGNGHAIEWHVCSTIASLLI